MEGIIALKFAMLQNELNERQCRHWAVSEVLSPGHGGAFAWQPCDGVVPHNVSPRDPRELGSDDTLTEHRVRHEGGFWKFFLAGICG